MPKLQKILLWFSLGDVVSLCAGSLLPLAFAPYHLYGMAILAPLLLLLTLLPVSPGRGAWRGGLFGMGFFSVGVSWVYTSIHLYGNTTPPLALLLTFLLMVALSLFYALMGYGFNRLFLKNRSMKQDHLQNQPALATASFARALLLGFPQQFSVNIISPKIEGTSKGDGGFLRGRMQFSPLRASKSFAFAPHSNKGSNSRRIRRELLGFPCLWVACEYLRSNVLSGFPWLLTGNSQVNSPLAGFAPIVGVYGVSFITIFIAALLAFLIVEKSSRLQKALAVCLLAALGTTGYALGTVHWTRSEGHSLTFSLLQGNIAQEVKWNPNQLLDTLAVYERLIKSQLGQDLIILPEAAIPASYQMMEGYINDLSALAKRHDSTLLIGIPTEAPQKQSLEQSFFNGLSMSGKYLGTYNKRHLVPFGEYLPLERWLRGLINFFDIPMSNFMPGSLEQKNLSLSNGSILPLICYEIAYPSLIYKGLPEAGLLLAISDDSWFGLSNAQAQHLEIGQMRALETGRYLLFGTNNGTTALVNPHGKITHSLAPFTEGVLTGTVDIMEGATPLITYGESPILLLISLLFFYALIKKEIE